MNDDTKDNKWPNNLQSIKAINKIESDLERLRMTAQPYQDLIDRANAYQTLAEHHSSNISIDLYKTINRAGLYNESFQSPQDRIERLLERLKQPQDISRLLERRSYSTSQYLETYKKLSEQSINSMLRGSETLEKISSSTYEALRFTTGQSKPLQETIEKLTTNSFLDESLVNRLHIHGFEYYKLAEATKNLSELAIQHNLNNHLSIIDRLKELSEIIPSNLYGVWPNSRISIQVLVDQGWFPDFSAPIEIVIEAIHDYYTYHEEHGIADANQHMVEHFEEIMENIDEYIPEDFPEKRLAIVKEAIQAHINGMYHVSTPIFLIQADGYAHQKHKKPIWGLPKGQDGLFAHARKQKIEDESLALIIEPLISRNLYLAASQPVRETIAEPDHGLNRNTLLHGINIDYGSRENSARCFSFFWYTVFFMEAFFPPELA